MLSLLDILLQEFREKLKETVNNQIRSARFPNMPQQIKVAIGMRRVGKTSFLLQEIRHLMHEHKVPIESILYINFEDDRLIPCTQAKLRELIDSFYTLYPQNHDRTCYLFLDEIQNVEDWPLVIRRIFDTKKVQIYLSGSSSKLLSKEIHTSLRGRAISQEIWPYSFAEYLSAQNINFSSSLLGQKQLDILSYQLRNYLNNGGFPETVTLQEEERRQLLQSYVDVAVMRDIVERYDITNISLIKYMTAALLKNSGNAFSVHKFHNDVKSQGINCSKNTLHDYLSYIEDAYLAFAVPLFSESIRKIHTNPRKTYAIDTGLSKAYTFGRTENIGHLFENLFFLDLRRKGHKVYYYLTQNRLEVDFLSIDRLGEMHLYQIAWDTKDEKTMQREQRALKTAEEELNISGEIITPTKYIEAFWND